MSFDALAWAGKCQPGSAPRKLVLLALADRHNPESNLSYPSVQWLVEWTGLNRKTVIAALDDLEAAKLISDSGERVGKTGQVKAYTLHIETVPKVEQFQKRNSSVFSAKQSQKRDTEPVKEPVDTLSNERASKRAKPGKAKPVECPDDVSPEVWADFLRHRKAKRAIVTNRVLNDFRREAEDVGWPLERAMQESITRGWQGFLAKWVKDDGNRNQRNSQAGHGAGSRDGFLNACFDAAMGGNGTGDPFGRAASQARSDSAPAFPQIATSWNG